MPSESVPTERADAGTFMHCFYPFYLNFSSDASGSKGAEKERAWSVDEQKALEAALKSVPKDDPDRWQSVANLVAGRTKNEVIRRCKVGRQIKMLCSRIHVL